MAVLGSAAFIGHRWVEAGGCEGPDSEGKIALKCSGPWDSACRALHSLGPVETAAWLASAVLVTGRASDNGPVHPSPWKPSIPKCPMLPWIKPGCIFKIFQNLPGTQWCMHNTTKNYANTAPWTRPPRCTCEAARPSARSPVSLLYHHGPVCFSISSLFPSQSTCLSLKASRLFVQLRKVRSSEELWLLELRARKEEMISWGRMIFAVSETWQLDAQIPPLSQILKPLSVVHFLPDLNV